MQAKSSPCPISLGLALGRQQQQKKDTLLSTSIVAFFREARAGATFLECVTYILKVLFCNWVCQIVHRVFHVLLGNWQTEEDGVMGGNSRRSKHSAKASSTVICDLTASVEDWKQQIKVKDSIPANQQRLIFTSQRTVKQNFALAKLLPSRQWQIVVDASIEDICKDLRHWRATLHSKNTSAELLQPLVLKETDDLALFFHSRAADELREIGVPCRVFFLSFEEWISPLQTKKLTPSNKQLRNLDLKVDEDFREDLFFINLYGDLNGLPIPVPLRYEMNGSQLATKLFMVEQTAQYREDQKQRYQHRLAPALKDSNDKNFGGSLEANCETSCSNDFVVEIEQNCELTAIISRDHHRLRCIVLPVITIPLAEIKDSAQHPYVHLLNRDLEEGPRGSASNVLALPSTSEIGERSTINSRSVVEEEHPGASPEISTRKNTKKKRKKRPKKTAKESMKNCTQSGYDATVEVGSSCGGPSEEAAVDTANYLNAKNSTKTEEDESQLLAGNKSNPASTSSPKDEEDLSLPEVQSKANFSKRRTSSADLDQQQTCSSTSAASKCVSSTRHEHICEEETESASDHALSSGINDEILKVCDASPHSDMLPATNPNVAFHDHDDVHGCLGLEVTDPAQPVSVPGCNSGTHSISKLAGGGTKKLKEPTHTKFWDETESTLGRETTGNYATNSHDFPNEREDQSFRNTKVNQWMQKSVEGQYYPPQRSRINHNFYTGGDDSRSSAPFWRHQRDSFPVLSTSWSKPRPVRADDGEGISSSSTFRQLRNRPGWEQLPNLRPATSGSAIHWENRASVERPWSRGQSYSSFNMQQRRLGKNNKISQKFSDRWQPQGMPDDRVALDSKPSNALFNSPSVSFNRNSEHTKTSFEGLNTDDTDSVQGPRLSMNLGCKEEICKTSAREALEPCIKVAQTTANTLNSLQDARLVSELDKSGLQRPKSQVTEHVYEILSAVNASYECWNIYEQVSTLNGKSLCEFERVAKAVAPTIRASTSKQSWKPTGCLCESLVSRSKNSWQIPDARLSTLWQWYEEPSSYGLKVKLSESSKRTGSNFQAFFVPYLSAIQLFGWSRKKETPLYSDFLNEPIFSILLPRPKVNDELYASEQKKASQEGVVSEPLDTGAVSSSGRQCHCDVELLYEFFEVEKPQYRKPLTDRIKELALMAELSSEGNVHVLNNAKIEDLHPSSWFAVAWYPIYKIPDEAFRSAFLTYHCLSCLELMCSRSANTNHCMDTCMHTITAPVVGLMSYNAQVKEWFSSSPSCDASPDDVLRQYLAKLETAATSMARGSCEKPSSFKHADFTFFQSRGR